MNIHSDFTCFRALRSSRLFNGCLNTGCIENSFVVNITEPTVLIGYTRVTKTENKTSLLIVSNLTEKKFHYNTYRMIVICNNLFFAFYFKSFYFLNKIDYNFIPNEKSGNFLCTSEVVCFSFATRCTNLI